jgi:FKBP-type peptidyl-prolyl cis-trans isomerase 2
MNKGDIIHLEYDLWIISPDGREDLFDTTNELLAIERKIHDSKKVYKPVPVIVDYQRVFKGLDKSLLSAELGKEYIVEIPPSEGAGERNPRLVELHSIREIERLPEFRKKGAVLQIGTEIMMKGKKGTIVSITAGRVRVDFNDVLAGKKLKYRYKIVKVDDTPEDKIKSLLSMHYKHSEEFKISVQDTEVEIILADSCKYDPLWSDAKFRIVADLRDVLNFTKIKLIEEYVKKSVDNEQNVRD